MQAGCETCLLSRLLCSRDAKCPLHALYDREDVRDAASSKDCKRWAAVQACINFGDNLGSSCGHSDLSSAAVVHHLLTSERDEILYESLLQSSLDQPKCVVGVVGVAHVPGIVQLWTEGTSSAAANTVKPSLVTSHSEIAPAESFTEQGVRRSLLSRFLELSCSLAVNADMQRQLPALPLEAEEAFACSQELYGSPRMLLAALPKEHLDKARR